MSSSDLEMCDLSNSSLHALYLNYTAGAAAADNETASYADFEGGRGGGAGDAHKHCTGSFYLLCGIRWHQERKMNKIRFTLIITVCRWKNSYSGM